MNAQLTPANELASKAKTPFAGASPDYEVARKALLEDEIEFRRHMTRLGEQRRALPPGPVITKNYRFKDEQALEVGLKDLFGDRDTLVAYFWMYGPQRERPCRCARTGSDPSTAMPPTSSSGWRSRSWDAPRWSGSLLSLRRGAGAT